VITESNMRSLPFLMRYQFDGGPATVSETPVGLSFPNDSATGVNIAKSDVSSKALSLWIEASFSQKYSQKDGRLDYRALLECPTGSVPQFLRHAFHIHETYSHAEFYFRVRTVDPARIASMRSDTNAISTGGSPIRMVGRSNSFQMSLEDLSIENIVRTGSGDGSRDWVSLLAHGGDLSRSAPPALNAAWNRNL